MNTRLLNEKPMTDKELKQKAAQVFDKLHDKQFRAQLRANPKECIAELGYNEVDADTDTDAQIVVVTSTDKITYLSIIINNSDITPELLPQIIAAGVAASSTSSVGSLGSASTVSSVMSCWSSLATASTAGSAGSIDVVN